MKNKAHEWDEAARRVQQAGRIGDLEQEEKYSGDQVRRAVVYTRQDIVLIVVYLSWINWHLRNITWALVAIAALGALLALHWLFPVK